MDFMKVFDQTVREIKREVNLKVLKVPEIEQKVLDATDDEPWGPHGTALAEIALATKKFTECQMVMNVLWTRLTETGKNWRYVYKALAVIEYLVAHGSERSVDDIIEHTFQISSLASFEYVEPSGKDLGINVRKKAETIVSLLNNKDKIQEVRNKASSNREKYFGLSSSGITYKSGAASFSSSGWKSSDRYGGFGNTKDDDTYQDSYKEKDKYDEDKFEKTTKSKKEPSHYGSKDQDSVAVDASKTSKMTSKPNINAAVVSQNSSVASNNYDDDDFDDFDPRGMTNAKTPAGSNQVDPFGQNLFGDLLDSPVPVPTDQSDLNNDKSEVDLFADADFVSATPQSEAGKAPVPQGNVDLFTPQPAPSPAVSSTFDFFAAPNPAPQPDNNISKSDATTNVVDPFAAVPLNNFDNSDTFGSFTSHTGPISTASTEHSSNDGSNANGNGTSVETKPVPQKDPFQVKSGIWADSLSRGIIDLNISARSLAKSKSMSLRNKTNAMKARFTVYSLLKNRKLSFGAIRHKIHALLGNDTHDEEDEKNKAVVVYNAKTSELPSTSGQIYLTDYEYDHEEDDNDKYPDLRNSLFDEDDLDLGDPNASAIDLVKNSKEDSENFNLEDEVDQVADLFILKFHKKMRLQKLESFKRYQEMLERST